MDRLLLVDGSNLLFQMYYGMPGRITGKNGQPVQGILGFVGALGRLLKMTEPTHIAVVFDGQCHNERKDLDPGYKANRPDYSQLEDSPFSQLPDIYRALELLQIPCAETTCCEADDWIAGYAYSCPDSMELIIVSQDSDFFQLIRDNVRILRYRGDRSVLCDRSYLQEKFGILPEQYADFKALVGDSADNIPGIRGIGPKTAAALLQEFSTAEELLQNVLLVKKPSVRAALQQEAPRLLLSRQLICLRADARLPFAPEQLRCRAVRLSSTEVMKRLGLF